MTAKACSLIDNELKLELIRLYRHEQRYYHGIAHIESLLGLAQEYHVLFTDSEVVEAAIWFHDAIYDSRANDNEARSADFARCRLVGRIELTRLDRIVAMILGTAKHQLPPLDNTSALRDAELFLDMDMSILGADPEAFDRYENAVRKEYAWVPETGWATGRSNVLRSFLDRPFIYLSAEFRDRFELRARENIRRSLLQLNG